MLIRLFSYIFGRKQSEEQNDIPDDNFSNAALTAGIPVRDNDMFCSLKKLLTCNVCFDFSREFNQCSNGHLICCSCSLRIEQEAFSNNSVTCCPVCRISLQTDYPKKDIQSDSTNTNSSSSVNSGLQRCLLAEKLAAELPSSCKYCGQIFPDKIRNSHEADECLQMPCSCTFAWLGCKWQDARGKLQPHLEECQLKEIPALKAIEKLNGNLNTFLSEIQKSVSKWEQLKKLLIGNTHLKYGLRGYSGLRLLPVKIMLTKLEYDVPEMSRVLRSGRKRSHQSSTINNVEMFVGSLACLPLTNEQTLWFRIRLYVIKSNISDEERPSKSSCSVFPLASSDDSDKEKMYYSLHVMRSKFNKPDFNAEVSNNMKIPNGMIHVVLDSLKTEDPDHTIHVVDSWHMCRNPRDSSNDLIGFMNDKDAAERISATPEREFHNCSSIWPLKKCDIDLNLAVKSSDSRPFNTTNKRILVSNQRCVIVSIVLTVDPSMFLLKQQGGGITTRSGITLHNDEEFEFDDDNASDDELYIIGPNASSDLAQALETTNSVEDQEEVQTTVEDEDEEDGSLQSAENV